MDTVIAVMIVAGVVGLLYFIKSRRDVAAKDADGSGIGRGQNGPGDI